MAGTPIQVVVNNPAPPLPLTTRENTTAVVQRATDNTPVPPDDFATHQTAVARAMYLPEPELALWLDSLTVEEARDVLGYAHGVADEHRIRAEQANMLESRLRDHLGAAASHGLAVPSPR